MLKSQSTETSLLRCLGEAEVWLGEAARILLRKNFRPMNVYRITAAHQDVSSSALPTINRCFHVHTSFRLSHSAVPGSGFHILWTQPTGRAMFYVLTQKHRHVKSTWKSHKIIPHPVLWYFLSFAILFLSIVRHKSGCLRVTKL